MLGTPARGTGPDSLTETLDGVTTSSASQLAASTARSSSIPMDTPINCSTRFSTSSMHQGSVSALR